MISDYSCFAVCLLSYFFFYFFDLWLFFHLSITFNSFVWNELRKEGGIRRSNDTRMNERERFYLFTFFPMKKNNIPILNKFNFFSSKWILMIVWWWFIHSSAIPPSLYHYHFVDRLIWNHLINNKKIKNDCVGDSGKTYIYIYSTRST